jgi:transcriptional regulator with XRE-family HTH domain
MKTRKLELGDRNLIGARVTQARLAKGMKQVELLAKLQLAGVDISIPALSLLEGQKRPVSDIELNALADILEVPVDWLLGREQL